MSERLNRIPCSGHSDIKIEAQFEITDDETNKRSCYTQDRNTLSRIYSATQSNLEVKFPLPWQLAEKKMLNPRGMKFFSDKVCYLFAIHL